MLNTFFSQPRSSDAFFDDPATLGVYSRLMDMQETEDLPAYPWAKKMLSAAFEKRNEYEFRLIVCNIFEDLFPFEDRDIVDGFPMCEGSSDLDLGGQSHLALLRDDNVTLTELAIKAQIAKYDSYEKLKSMWGDRPVPIKPERELKQYFQDEQTWAVIQIILKQSKDSNPIFMWTGAKLSKSIENFDLDTFNKLMCNVCKYWAPEDQHEIFEELPIYQVSVTGNLFQILTDVREEQTRLNPNFDQDQIKVTQAILSGDPDPNAPKDFFQEALDKFPSI